MNIILVISLLSVNLAVSLTYFFIMSNEKIKNTFNNLPVIIQKFYVVLFVAPLFTSPFIETMSFNTELSLSVIAGGVLSIIGFTFIILSFFKIGAVPSIRERSTISSTGVYGIVRHPIYGGTIILFLGLILIQRSFIPALYFPVSVTLYYIMTIFEERDLVKTYGNEYLEYRKKVTKRIIPFVI